MVSNYNLCCSLVSPVRTEEKKERHPSHNKLRLYQLASIPIVDSLDRVIWIDECVRFFPPCRIYVDRFITLSVPSSTAVEILFFVAVSFRYFDGWTDGWIHGSVKVSNTVRLAFSGFLVLRF